MTVTSTLDRTTAAATSSARWGYLTACIICMVMIANLQYGWTLFVGPIGQKHGWDRASIQVAFTIFVLTETWLVPAEGYLVDRLGPRVVTLVAGVLVGLSWVLNSIADSLFLLYLAATVGGIGADARLHCRRTAAAVEEIGSVGLEEIRSGALHFGPVRGELLERAQVIQDPVRAALGGGHEISLVNLEIGDRHPRQVELERLPVLPVVE